MDMQTVIMERRAPADAMTMIKAITPTSDDVSIGRRRLHRKSLGIAVLVDASYMTLVFGPQLIASRIVSAIVPVVALTATATSVFHDANHASFSSGVDRHRSGTVRPPQPFAAMEAMAPLSAALHVGALWVSHAAVAADLRLRRTQTRRNRRALIPRRPRRGDVAALFASKVLLVSWALAIPFIFHRWWIVLSCYLAISSAVGLLLATMFQLAHCTDIADFPLDSEPRRGSDFVWHQLRTSVDVRARTVIGRKALHWLMGGLGHQVEHHLPPASRTPSIPSSLNNSVDTAQNTTSNFDDLPIEQSRPELREQGGAWQWESAVSCRGPSLPFPRS